jgi:hypothetical protein
MYPLCPLKVCSNFVNMWGGGATEHKFHWWSSLRDINYIFDTQKFSSDCRILHQAKSHDPPPHHRQFSKLCGPVSRELWKSWLPYPGNSDPQKSWMGLRSGYCVFVGGDGPYERRQITPFSSLSKITRAWRERRGKHAVNIMWYYEHWPTPNLEGRGISKANTM